MADPAKAALYDDRLLPSVRKAYDAHPDDCGSLGEFWYGRTGGVTCLSDIFDCEACGAYFYVEGVSLVVDGPEGDELYCECCARSRRPAG